MRVIRGVLVHLRLQLITHVRNRQALLYSLVLPLLFLAGFAAVFRAGEPPLLDQAGQLVTLTLLGGACFGLPVTLVAERQAGLWRRHRLNPVSPVWILIAVLATRCALLVASLGLQVAVAHLAWGMPLPADLWSPACALSVSAAAFLCLGLLIAAAADTVPAVQALGQCLFLPVVILGGVGVPVAALPDWAQVFSAFTPGRYSVELVQAAWIGAPTAESLPWFALLAIGMGAGTAGLLLFRWSPTHRPSGSERFRASLGLVPWLAVGAWAALSGRIGPVSAVPEPEHLDEARIRAIDTTGLPADDSLVTPMRALDRSGDQAVRDLRQLLPGWQGRFGGDPRDRVRGVLSAAALADAGQDVLERDLALAVYLHLRDAFPPGELRRLLAWIALTPERGRVASDASELGVKRRAPEALVRERTRLYALKFMLLIRDEGVTSPR
ncbi:MAG: ABC transporter permease [Opitutaceae bacterium]|nr:ABC transporter permease [Opitutaceae bacterium]